MAAKTKSKRKREKAEIDGIIANGWTYEGLSSVLFQTEYGKSEQEMQSLKMRYVNACHLVFFPDDKKKQHPVSFEKSKLSMKKKAVKAVRKRLGEPKDNHSEQKFFSEYCKEHEARYGKRFMAVPG